jgi:hypothetical protein
MIVNARCTSVGEILDNLGASLAVNDLGIEATCEDYAKYLTTTSATTTNSSSNVEELVSD